MGVFETDLKTSLYTKNERDQDTCIDSIASSSSHRIKKQALLFAS